MKLQNIFGAAGVGCGWALILLSLATGLLFWRIDNEPGVQGAPEMLALALGMACAGVLLFAGSNFFLLAVGTKTALLAAWGLVVLVSLLAYGILPWLLIVLV
ncbi:MAG: hypothetical protein ACOYYS_19010 [Chloroflexota bacterium]